MAITFTGSGILTPAAPGSIVLSAAYFASLPTTLPGTAGVLWNNGGVLCVS